MKKLLMTVLFGSAIVLGACGGGGDNADKNKGGESGGTENASAAEDIFQSNCSSCHGSDLSGGAGPDLTKVGKKHDAKEIEDIIHNGKDGMPAQTQVSDKDAKTVAEWLASKK
ncbi:cytochrome c551 [Virgibacillus halophilus]|uniref:cytochrome c551 n=1 Tax=Tigheibacillus halophilus TaxID=361280 RepID=UPI0036256468